MIESKLIPACEATRLSCRRIPDMSVSFGIAFVSRNSVATWIGWICRDCCESARACRICALVASICLLRLLAFPFCEETSRK